MQKNAIETLMGGVVLLVAAGFVAFAYEHSSIKTVDGYNVKAVFNSAAGLSTGSDVRVGGIKIGVVSDMKLDPATYTALVSLQIRKDVEMPKDSSAAVVSDGLLGGKYVELTPGGDEKMLTEGDKITFTQSAVNLEQMIGKFMFSGGGVDDKSNEGKQKEMLTP